MSYIHIRDKSEILSVSETVIISNVFDFRRKLQRTTKRTRVKKRVGDDVLRIRVVS